MCENDITFARPDVWPPKEIETSMRRHADEEGGHCASHTRGLLERVRELEASRLTRKQVEDAAARLFFSEGGERGTELRLYASTEPSFCRGIRELSDVANLLCEALLPKE